MTKKPSGSSPTWHDPDDAPAWTEEQVARAELAHGDKVLRPATGTLTRARGRPKTENPKVHVSLRIASDVLERYRAIGPGWQTRINEVLRDGADRLPPSASGGIAGKSKAAGPKPASARLRARKATGKAKAG